MICEFFCKRRILLDKTEGRKCIQSDWSGKIMFVSGRVSVTNSTFQNM